MLHPKGTNPPSAREERPLSPGYSIDRSDFGRSSSSPEQQQGTALLNRPMVGHAWRAVLNYYSLWGSQRPAEPSLKICQQPCRCEALQGSPYPELGTRAAAAWQPANPFGFLSMIQGRHKHTHILAQQFSQPLRVSHVKKLCLVQLGFKFIARTLRHHNNAN